MNIVSNASPLIALVRIDDALLIMDERLGRDTARHFGIRYTGVVGVLIEAKDQKLNNSAHRGVAWQYVVATRGCKGSDVYQG